MQERQGFFLDCLKTKPARHGRGYFFCLSRLFHNNKKYSAFPFQPLPAGNEMP
jgi:hypothetical protein